MKDLQASITSQSPIDFAALSQVTTAYVDITERDFQSRFTIAGLVRFSNYILYNPSQCQRAWNLTGRQVIAGLRALSWFPADVETRQEAIRSLPFLMVPGCLLLSRNWAESAEPQANLVRPGASVVCEIPELAPSLRFSWIYEDIALGVAFVDGPTVLSVEDMERAGILRVGLSVLLIKPAAFAAWRKRAIEAVSRGVRAIGFVRGDDEDLGGIESMIMNRAGRPGDRYDLSGWWLYRLRERTEGDVGIMIHPEVRLVEMRGHGDLDWNQNWAAWGNLREHEERLRVECFGRLR
jgi:hypothetical protein